MTTVRMSALVAAVLMACSVVAQAEEPQGWKFEITPYAWLAGIEGDATVNGRDVDFEKEFSDIVDSVDMALGLHAIAQYDRFLMWWQHDYFSATTDNLDMENRSSSGSLDSKILLTEYAVGYQVDGWMEGQTFDLLVGVRTITFDNNLTVTGRGARRETEDPASDSRADGVSVVRPSILVLPSKIEGLRFNATMAIGGGASDMVYELQPQFLYQIGESITARLGYRTVGYKLKGDNNEDNELNIALAGLIFGLGVTF